MSAKLPGAPPELHLTLYLILMYKRYTRASCNSVQSCVCWNEMKTSLYRLQMTVRGMGIFQNTLQPPLGRNPRRPRGNRWREATRRVRPNPKTLLSASPSAGRLLNGSPTTWAMFWPNSKWFFFTYWASNPCKRVLNARRCIL